MKKMLTVCLSVGLHCWLDDVFACSAWLRDEEHLLINRISLRTNAMTNLTLDSVEELQVRRPSNASPCPRRPSNARLPVLATRVHRP